MACFVYIDGVEVDILRGSIQIDKRIEERSTASFTVVDSPGTADYVRGMPVEILKPGWFPPFHEKLFAGFIDTPGRARLAPGSGLLHDIVCMDNHYLADKRLVIKSYTTQTLGYIVNDIWADYLDAEGITIGEVQTGPTIKSAIFNYVHVSDAFDALKELSGYTWFIDEFLDLYFIDRTTNAAPWNLDGVTYRAVKGSVHLSGGNPLYRNRQYVRGGKGTTSLQTENFTGDGTIKSFTLGYPLALEPDIEEDAAPMTVGIKGLETGKDYYWNKGDNTVTADVVPGVGVDVEVQYYGQYPLISMADDYAARLAQQAIEGGTGIVEDIATEAQHESSDAINESALAKLKQYCQDAEKYIYQTYEDELAPGQIQEITYAPFGFTAHEMLIEAVSITANGDDIRYDISCITGPSMGSWAKFFANLVQRQDKQIKIGDSLLLVLIQAKEILEMTEVTSIDEDEFAVSGNVNRWLNSAPIDAGSIYNVQHERLEMTEVGSESHHATEDYKWDDGCKWDFATYG
jgi:hypothetical protein